MKKVYITEQMQQPKKCPKCGRKLEKHEVLIAWSNSTQACNECWTKIFNWMLENIPINVNE